MKIKFLLLLAVLTFALLPANAELTTDDVISREYLINHGHSDTAVDIVHLIDGAANGDEVVLPDDVKYKNRSTARKWFDSVFEYIDPGADRRNFLKEETKFYPGRHDLP